MENLQQVRALHALTRKALLDKRAATKLPAMILANGLLAATAFTFDKSRAEMLAVMNAVAHHLCERGLLNKEMNTARQLVQDLSERPSADLRLATSEALAYLGYVKRFAERGEN